MHGDPNYSPLSLSLPPMALDLAVGVVALTLLLAILFIVSATRRRHRRHQPRPDNPEGEPTMNNHQWIK